METEPGLFNEEEKKAGEEDIISLVKEYVATRIELGKLSLLERSVIVIANLLTDGFVVISLLLVFLFGSITLGLYLGELLGSAAGGFGLVTLIYLALALLMYFTKDGIVERFLINFMLKRITRRKKK